MKRGIQYILSISLTFVLISLGNGLYFKTISIGILLSVFLFICVIYIENAVDKLLQKKEQANR